MIIIDVSSNASYSIDLQLVCFVTVILSFRSVAQHIRRMPLVLPPCCRGWSVGAMVTVR